MRQASHRAVRVDFSKVATVTDVAARVAQAYADLPADPRRRVARWAARLGVSAKLGPVAVHVGPRTVRGAVENARAALLELLDVPLALAEADANLTVVCLDEFQDLLVADDALDGLVRSLSNITVRPRPILERAGDAVDELLAFTRGHPQRTMLVAHHLYAILDAEAPVEEPALQAIERALRETRDAHQALWDGLPRVERIVCVALADGQAPTGSRVADEHRVPRSTLQDALERLLSDGRQLQRDPAGAPYLLDPLFAEWLRRR